MDRARRRCRSTPVVVATVLACASCSLLGFHGELIEEDGSYLLAATDGGDSAGIGIAGRLALIGDCVGLHRQEGDAVVIWPSGTALVTTEPLVIDIPGYGELTDQVQIIGGGSEIDVEEPFGIDVPDSCSDRDMITFAPDPSQDRPTA